MRGPLWLLDAEDALLAERAADGDAWAFECLIRRHLGMMRAIAGQLTRSAHDADDAAQEACLTAWQTIDSLREPAKVRSWLLRITSRKAIDRIRARRGELDLDAVAPASDPGAGPELRTEVSVQMTELSRILSALPDLQRTVWILREEGGMSYREIAEALDQPESTVRGALSRARRALLVGLEGWA